MISAGFRSDPTEVGLVRLFGGENSGKIDNIGTGLGDADRLSLVEST
jgi:hypothetical protein